MAPRFFPLAVLLLAVAGLPGPAAQAPGARPASPYQILSATGRRPLPSVQAGDQDLVGLDDLAQAFSLTLRDDPLAGGVTVNYKGKTIALVADQPLASVGGRLVSMPSPAVRDGRRWLVPVDFVSRALALVYDARLDVRKTARLVIVGDLRVPRVMVRVENVGNVARVSLDSNPRTAATVTQEQNHVVIRFDADALDPTFPAIAPQGLVESIRLGDAPATIAIGLGARPGTVRVSPPAADQAAGHLVVELQAVAEGSGLPARPIPVPAPQPAPPDLPPLLIAPGVRTIVIDAGHGGTESGAKGASGTLEKDLTLSVARRLKAAIENRLGLRALLTRDADAVVTLDERTAFANNNQADVLISLHANASLRKELKGAEVLYMSGERDAQAAASTAATFPTFGGGSREIDVILWEATQRQHLVQSAALATMVDQQLRAAIPMNGQAVLQAPLRVLVGANMPAVLVEMGFLSSAEQEQAMASSEFQNAIVQALVNAVAQYRDTVERGQPAPPPSGPRPPGQP